MLGHFSSNIGAIELFDRFLDEDYVNPKYASMKQQQPSYDDPTGELQQIIDDLVKNTKHKSFLSRAEFLFQHASCNSPCRSDLEVLEHPEITKMEKKGESKELLQKIWPLMLWAEKNESDESKKTLVDAINRLIFHLGIVRAVPTEESDESQDTDDKKPDEASLSTSAATEEKKSDSEGSDEKKAEEETKEKKEKWNTLIEQIDSLREVVEALPKTCELDDKTKNELLQFFLELYSIEEAAEN